MKERRNSIRAPLVAKVKEIGTEVSHYFYSADISVGGMFLETDNPYPDGTALSLEIIPEIGSLPRAAAMGKVVNVKTHGKVVWRGEKTEGRKVKGMGILFTSVDKDNQKKLEKLVKMALQYKG